MLRYQKGGVSADTTSRFLPHPKYPREWIPNPNYKKPKVKDEEGFNRDPGFYMEPPPNRDPGFYMESPPNRDPGFSDIGFTVVAHGFVIVKKSDPDFSESLKPGMLKYQGCSVS